MKHFTLVVVVLFSSCVGCCIETNPQRALFAKHNTEMRVLLVAMEMFQSKNGNLPPNLEVLQESDAALADVPINPYEYSPEGIVVEDGSRWLLALPNPKDGTQLLVGRLPVEVTVKKPDAMSTP